MNTRQSKEGLPTVKAQLMRFAVLHTLLSRPAVLILTGISVAVVARQLDPTAFGVYALAYAVFGIMSEIGLFGLKPYLVTREKVDRSVMGRAVGLSLFVGLCLFATTILTLVLVPYADLRKGFGPTMLLFGGALLIQPLGLASEAVLERRLRFGFLSLLTIVGSAVNATLAILLVLSGWGIASLALAFLGEKLVRTFGLLLFAPEGRVRPILSRESQVLNFGSSYALSTTLPKLSGFAILSFLGAILGLPAVGLYNRAEAVVTLMDRAVMSALKPTILPILTTALRSGMAKAEVYGRKLRYLTAFLWPCVVGMIVLAEPLVLTLLGEQWGEAVVPAQILLIGALAIPFNKMSLKLFVAFGLLATYTRIQIAYQTLRVISAATGALLFGLPGAAFGLAAATLVKAGLIITVLHRETQQSWKEFIRILLEGAGVALLAAGGAAIGLLGMKEAAVWQLLIGGFCASIGALIGLIQVRHPVLEDLRLLIRRIGGGEAPVSDSTSFVRQR